MTNVLKTNSTEMINLHFEGSVTEENVDSVPLESGIYVAFVCNKLTDANGDYPCTRIAYIGKAESTDNLRNRIQEHFDNDHQQWKRRCNLSNDETFVYAYAVYNDQRICDVESALIYKNQPIVNTQHKNRYNGTSWALRINCTGSIGILKPQISVERDFDRA